LATRKRISRHPTSLRGTFEADCGSRELCGGVERQYCGIFRLGAAKCQTGEGLNGYGLPLCRFVRQF
jgi:hypothetical protein